MHIMRSCLCAEEGNGGGVADTGGAKIETQAARAEASGDLRLVRQRYGASKSENRVGKHRRRRESMEASGRVSRAGRRRERAGRKHVTACALFSLLSSLPGRAPAAGSGRDCRLTARCELRLRRDLSAVCCIVAAFSSTVLERSQTPVRRLDRENSAPSRDAHLDVRRHIAHGKSLMNALDIPPSSPPCPTSRSRSSA
jgi:hypothetical protein